MCYGLSYLISYSFDLIQNLNAFFELIFYPKESKLLSESGLFGYYNLRFVRLNRLSRFRTKTHFFLLLLPSISPKK